MPVAFSAVQFFLVLWLELYAVFDSISLLWYADDPSDVGQLYNTTWWGEQCIANVLGNLLCYEYQWFMQDFLFFLNSVCV